MVLERARFEVLAAGTLAEANAFVDEVAALAVAVVDYRMIEDTATELVRRLARAAVPVVVLTGYASRSVVDEVIDAGALAFVAKASGPRVLLRAIEQATHGRRFLCESTTAVLSQAGEQAHLSIRETEVLAAIASGMSTREIARQLGVAERTVDTHRERRHQKLGAHNVADLTREAVRRGLVRLM